MSSSRPLDRLARGELPANVAVMHVLMQATSPADARQQIEVARTSAGLGDGRADRIGCALALLDSNPQAFHLIKTVLGAVDHQPSASGRDAALLKLAAGFDRAARASAVGGSALYALGDPALLARATAEVVRHMGRAGLLARDRRLLEVGCGSGRFLQALSPEFAFTVGLEISAVMASAAGSNVADLRNSIVVLCQGARLDPIADQCVDVVLFADSFPYFVQVGDNLAQAMISESARVLRRGGRVLILNLSYRDNFDQDYVDLARWAAEANLQVIKAAEREFSLWDASTFLLAKSRL